MKTAMQELIEEMEYCYKDHNIFLKSTIEKAKKLLEKEKEQIIEAFESGMAEGDGIYSANLDYDANSSIYFNQTYNQNK